MDVYYKLKIMGDLDIIYFLVEDAIKPFEKICHVSEFDSLSLIVSVNTSWRDCHEVNNNFSAILFNLLSAFGGALTILDMAFSCWFFSSENINRFYLGFGSLILMCVGYLIYLISIQKIHKKWSDHY